MDDSEFNKKIEFLTEIEKFKNIKRRIKNSNLEPETNSDHSWHLAIIVMLFKNKFENKYDYTKMLEMALIHDLPEIYAGDMFPFDKKFNKEKKKKKELEAAKKIFSILDKKEEEKLMSLFLEYENLESKESQIIKSLDKIQPDIVNLSSKGQNWNEHNLTLEILENYKKEFISKDEFTKKLFYKVLDIGLKKGWLKEK